MGALLFQLPPHTIIFVHMYMSYTSCFNIYLLYIPTSTLFSFLFSFCLIRHLQNVNVNGHHIVRRGDHPEEVVLSVWNKGRCTHFNVYQKVCPYCTYVCQLYIKYIGMYMYIVRICVHVCQL